MTEPEPASPTPTIEDLLWLHRPAPVERSEQSYLASVLNRSAFFADLSFLNRPWDEIARKQTALRRAIQDWIDSHPPTP